MASLLAFTTSVPPVGPQSRRLVHQPGDAQPPQLGAQFLRRGGHQAAELVDGPDPLLACAAPGDAQHPDASTLPLRVLPVPWPARQGGSSRFHRVDGIGLAGPRRSWRFGRSTSTTLTSLS